MLAFEAFSVTVCSDADGGMRLTPSATVDFDACQRLNEAVIAALRSGVPRLEVDLRDAAAAADDINRVLHAGELLARHLSVEFRVTRTDGEQCDGRVGLARRQTGSRGVEGRVGARHA